MSQENEQGQRKRFLLELRRVSASETAKTFFVTCLNHTQLANVPEGGIDERSLEAVLALLYDQLIEGTDLNLPGVWCALGIAYFQGWGTEESPGLAIYWYRKAAESGDTDAMLHIAHALVSMSRHPSEAERREASSWYERAVSFGNHGWITWLGFESRRNCDAEVNYDEALDWFLNAFMRPDGDHVHLLRGCGYMSPNRDALDHYERLAVAGEPESCFFLGLLFGNPIAPFCDLEKAMDWMVQAVERKCQNAQRAMLELAWHCFLGSGKVHDVDGAYGWLDLLFSTQDEMSHAQREGRKLLHLVDELSDQQTEGGV